MSTHSNTSKLSFPHDPLTKIGQDTAPTPLEIHQLLTEIYANAMSVKTTLGQNNTGLLGMFMPDNDFQALPGITAAFAVPNAPGAAVLAGTADQRATQLAAHTERVRVYHETIAVERQMKGLLIDAVPALYIEDLKDATLGYAESTTQEIIEHLIDHYGTIDADELEANAEKLETPWDPSTPIEVVFTNGKRCRDIAEAGDDPISDPAYIRALLKVFDQSGVFGTAIHEWKLKPAAQRTPENLKIHFMTANKERLRHNTTAKSILNQANAAAKTETTKTAPTGEAITGMWYCWSHGLGYNKDHTSATCTDPAPGHQRDATCFQKKGGNCNIRRRRGETAVYRRPRNGNGNNNTQTTQE